jgi:GDP-L-fucose synthase
MKKILITGGSGYIAGNIYKNLKNIYNIEIITKKDFSLLDTDEVNSFFNDKFYDVIIHTAIIGGSRLKDDPTSVVHDNVKMLYNILSNRANYSRLINLGSGAELGYPKNPYGMSKSLVSNVIESLSNHYNLRIFAVFNEYELKTRFIKSNILNYINKEDLIIHQDKYMDFIYMNDLVTLVRHYIQGDNLPKVIDCVYSDKVLLSEISNFINNLDKHKVDIQIENLSKSLSYVGNGTTLEDLNLKLVGLEKGIQNTYIALKK